MLCMLRNRCRCVILPASPTPSGGVRLSFGKTGVGGAPLEGAEFTLFLNGEPYRTAVSQASGVVSFGQIPPGSYAMRETFVPDGYPVNGQVYDVQVSADGSVLIDSEPLEFFTVADLPEMALIVINYLATTGETIQPSDEFMVMPGSFGPFIPPIIPEYTFAYLAPDSDAISGTVGPNERVDITFVYAPNEVV